MPARLTLAALVVVLAGCGGGYRSTLLPTAEPGEYAYGYRIEVPDGYDIRSVDYDAALVGIASGDSSSTSTSIAGRGVVAVYAVERATGEEVVFVYDDVLARPEPTAVIRIERTADGRRAEARGERR